MRNLLENLRNAPTPLIVKSKAGIIKAVKDVHLAVLRAALKLDEATDVSGKVASLRRYALFLEDVAFDFFVSIFYIFNNYFEKQNKFSCLKINLVR